MTERTGVHSMLVAVGIAGFSNVVLCSHNIAVVRTALKAVLTTCLLVQSWYTGLAFNVRLIATCWWKVGTG